MKAIHTKTARSGWRFSTPRDSLPRITRAPRLGPSRPTRPRRQKERAENKQVKALGMSGEHDTEDEDHWDMSDDEEGDDMFASANTLDGKSWLEARGKGSGISQTIPTPAVTATTNHFQAVSSSIRSHNGSAESAELNRSNMILHINFISARRSFSRSRSRRARTASALSWLRPRRVTWSIGSSAARLTLTSPRTGTSSAHCHGARSPWRSLRGSAQLLKKCWDPTRSGHDSTGATLHGIDARKALPAYKHLVRKEPRHHRAV